MGKKSPELIPKCYVNTDISTHLPIYVDKFKIIEFFYLLVFLKIFYEAVPATDI